MLKKIIAIISIATLTACGNPQNTVIPSDISKWDTELKPSIEKLDAKDKELFVAYITRSKLGEAFGGAKMAPGTTIGQAIAQQKEWQDEQTKKEAAEKALKEKILAERAAKQKRIDDALTVTLIKLSLERDGYQKNQLIELGFANNGTKDILGIKGSIHFINIFDTDVGSVSFSYDDGVAVGSTKTWNGSRHYNEFIPEHKAIANLEPGKFKVKFEPEMIVFADGEKLIVEK